MKYQDLSPAGKLHVQVKIDRAFERGYWFGFVLGVVSAVTGVLFALTIIHYYHR